jgi:uncharacterized protein (DUF2384 family)
MPLKSRFDMSVHVAWLTRKREDVPTDDEIQQRIAYTARTLQRAHDLEEKEVRSRDWSSVVFRCHMDARQSSCLVAACTQLNAHLTSTWATQVRD